MARIYFDERRRKWYGDIQGPHVPGGRMRWVIGTDRKTAQQVANSVEIDLLRRRAGFATEKSFPTFDELADRYLAEYSEVFKSDPRRDHVSLKRLRPAFGPKRIDQIVELDVLRYIKQRCQGPGLRGREHPPNSTVNREIALLKHMFKKAVEWYGLPRNPVAGVKLLTETPFSPRIVTEEDEARYYANASPMHRWLAQFALWTGRRRRECLTIEKAWVNFEKMRYSSRVFKKRRGMEFREFDLNAKAAEAARAAMKLTPPECPFLFARSDGRPIKSTTKAHLGARRRAGLGNLRFHDLRHSAATRMIEGGAHPVAVMAQMAHSSLDVTMRYVHQSDAHRAKAVEAMERGVRRDISEGAVDRGGVVDFDTRRRAV